ncbi:DUF4838 domain-containing protein [bacterium]|nr:DUF4838 domain-containing protein [bacterium]
MIKNPGFEADEYCWERHIVSGKFNFAIDETISRNGTKSARIDCIEKGRARWYQNTDNAKKGSCYKFSCYVKAKSSENVKSETIGDILITTDGVAFYEKFYPLETWQYISGIITANSPKLTLVLELREKGTVWFDDIKLSEYKPKVIFSANVEKHKSYVLYLHKLPPEFVGKGIRIYGENIVDKTYQSRVDNGNLYCPFIAKGTGKIEVFLQSILDIEIKKQDIEFLISDIPLIDKSIPEQVYKGLWEIEDKDVVPAEKKSIHIHKKLNGNCILIKDGKFLSKTFKYKDNNPTLNFASEELKKHLQMISKNEISLMDSDTINEDGIYIGRIGSWNNKEIRNILREYPLANRESFIIYAKDSKIFILGKDYVGCLYGVYHFLKNYIGFYFVAPGENGTYFEKTSNITISNFIDVESPDFLMRKCHGWISHREKSTSNYFLADWIVKQGMNYCTIYWGNQPWKSKELRERLSTLGISIDTSEHSFKYWIPNDLFETKPDFFPLIEGKRRKTGTYRQINTANSELIEYISKKIIAHIEEYPDVKKIGIIPTDSNLIHPSWSEDDNSIKLDGAKTRYIALEELDQSKSRRYLIFANEIAKRVCKVFPDCTLTIQAYHETLIPPIDIKPHPNLQLAIAFIKRDYLHSLADKRIARNRYCYKTLLDWMKITDFVWIYEYIHGRYPFPRLPIMQEDFKHYFQIGIKGINFGLSPYPEGWKTHGMNYYIASNLCWNAEKDYRILVKRFIKGYYQEASSFIEKFYETLHDQKFQEDVQALAWQFDVPKIASKNTALKCLDYLSKARNHAEKDIVKDRVNTLYGNFRTLLGKDN